MRPTNANSIVNYRGGELAIQSELRDENDYYSEEFSDIDWQTWANFCENNPQFASMDLEMQRKRLDLNIHQPIIKQALIDRLHRVKIASIFINPGAESYRVPLYYWKLYSLRELVIVNASLPIQFITSKHLESLEVFGVRDNTEDILNPILQKSRNINSLVLFHGGLSTDSLIHLQSNPLKSLILHFVEITDLDKLTWLFNHSPQLCRISFRGNTQAPSMYLTCYFNPNNPNLDKLQILQLDAIFLNKSFYDNLLRCPNLCHIKISYTNSETIEYIYILLTRLTKLITISLTSITYHNDLNMVNDQLLYNAYEPYFKNRGISIDRTVRIIPSA